MKVLVIATRIPYPLTDGLRVHLYNFAKHCQKDGNCVDLLYIGRVNEYMQYEEELQKVFTSVYVIPKSVPIELVNVFCCIFEPKIPFQVALYRNSRMRDKLNEIKGEYDVVIGWLIRTTEYLEQIDSQKVVLDLCDAVSYN